MSYKCKNETKYSFMRLCFDTEQTAMNYVSLCL